MESLRDLTIIIPTCNRPLELERAIEYWRDTPITIHIVDGSDKPCFQTGVLPDIPTITYHHLAPFISEGKMANIARRICYSTTLPVTKYSAFCADDDSFTIPALVSCIQTMNRNVEFSAVVGRTAQFKFQDGIFVWNRRYGSWKSSEVLKSAKLEIRVSQKPHISIYYGVVRSSLWCQIHRRANEFVFSHRKCNEQLAHELGRAFCRTEVIDQYLWIKKCPEININNFPQGNFLVWLHNEENSSEVQLLIEILRKSYLYVDKNLKIDVADKISQEVLERFSLPTKQPLGKIIRREIMTRLISIGSGLPKEIRLRINRGLTLGIQEKVGFYETPEFPGQGKWEQLMLKPREELRLHANI